METKEPDYKIQMIIKSDDCVYIKVLGVGFGTYHSTIILNPGYLIDGVVAEPTSEEHWFKVKAIPKRFQVKESSKRVNIRFVLRNGNPALNKLPESIPATSSGCLPEEYKMVSGCYELKYDKVEGEWKDLSFETEIIYKSNDFEWLCSKYPHQSSLIDRIEFNHDILDSVRPCMADSKQMYKIIRNHIKKNINPAVATITSDYDFVFSVSRDVKLVVPERITLNVGTSRRPRVINRFNEKKSVVIYSITTESSYLKEGCVYPDPVVGKNAKDLDEKIDKVLEEIMEEINKEFCECPHCNGYGYVEVKK